MARRQQRVKVGRPQSSTAAPHTERPRVELVLTGIAPTGEAIGRLDGQVVFVPYGLPGETVQVHLVEQKRNFARGEITAVIAPGAERVAPPCPYFGRCGGCDWQPIDYTTQLRFKTGIVREQLARIGGLDQLEVLPCIGSPTAYGYRNHARFAVAADGAPGYRVARSHQIIAVADCPILEEPLREQLRRGELAGLGRPGDEIELTGWDGTIAVGASTYQVSPGAFFQANTAVAARLVEAVVGGLALRGSERVLDLYCGVGLFSVPLGLRSRRIVGVEGNPVAAQDAVANLAAASVNGTIVAGDVAEALAAPEVANAAWDVVVLDPPRTGVDAPALAAIARLAAPRLAYISCEPATLARDLRYLVEQGYQVTSVQPFDMFPQTHHVEALAQLRRQS